MLNATTAYRRDRAQHTEAFSSADGEWIAIAALVSQAALGSPKDERVLIRRADQLARDCFGIEEVRSLARFEWRARACKRDPLVLLVAAIQEAGAFNLGAALADASLATRASFSDLQRGRLSAQRARISYKLGDRDLAAEQYAELDRFAKKIGSGELRGRAALGLANVAHLRGNYPETLRMSRHALRFARQAALPRLHRRAAYAVMVALTQTHLYDEAIGFAWEMYTCSRRDPVEEAASLVALGQLLLRLNEPAAAYSAFTRVLSRRLPTRLMIPALAGIAIAAVQREKQDLGRARWALGELDRFRHTSVHMFDWANALLAKAIVLPALGERKAAEAAVREALDIAERYRYNEIVVEAEAMSAVWREPIRVVRAASTKVARYFEGQPLQRLPAHVHAAGDALIGV